MGNLHSSPRHLLPTPEVHKKQCVDRVISENLVSALRKYATRDLTHGFITKNHIESADVIERFASLEKRLPSPTVFTQELVRRLIETDGHFTYHFPLHLAKERELTITCPSVTIKQCSRNLYTVRFGDGFCSPHLCESVPYAPIALRRIDFKLAHIPDSHGTKAFSDAAAARAVCQYLCKAGASVDPTDDSTIIVSSALGQWSVTITTLYCPFFSGKAIQTTEGLAVIPVPDISTGDSMTEKVSVFITHTPSSSTAPTNSQTNAELQLVSSTVEQGLEHFFGEHSRYKLRSIRDIPQTPPSMTEAGQ